MDNVVQRLTDLRIPDSAVQVSDGNIALYSANSDGTKQDLIVEWNDNTIVKSDLNTLTLTGQNAVSPGTGNVQTRGFCGMFHSLPNL